MTVFFIRKQNEDSGIVDKEDGPLNLNLMPLSAIEWNYMFKRSEVIEESVPRPYCYYIVSSREKNRKEDIEIFKNGLEFLNKSRTGFYNSYNS